LWHAVVVVAAVLHFAAVRAGLVLVLSQQVQWLPCCFRKTKVSLDFLKPLRLLD
jgi:hypothetical protein